MIFAEPDGRITWANAAALAVHGVADPAELGATVDKYQQRFTLHYRDVIRLRIVTTPSRGCVAVSRSAISS